MIQNIMQNYISPFVFYYPIAMSIVWIIGGLFFWFVHERKRVNFEKILSEHKPEITILVPCYNESNTIEATCKSLQDINYPNYRVLFINDASTDNTEQLIDKYVSKTSIFKQKKLKKNGGKANALNAGLTIVDTPLVMVLDADTILDKDALNWLVMPFINNKNIGAVTGNVLIIDKSSSLSKFQAAEFTCIIGLIKRCQQMLGTMFTISGCATLFRTEALIKCGGFSSITATEDVDVTWRIQREFYRVLFEPNAKVHIQVPKNIIQYIKQRKRWALGGWHLLRQHKDIFRDYKLKNLWLIYLEFLSSCIWAFCFATITLWWFGVAIAEGFLTLKILLSWPGAVISFIFIIQAIIATAINDKYDKKLWNCFFWICWYPLIFFATGVALIIWTFPIGMFKSTSTSGKWNSPTRDPRQIININK